jgi:phosphopantetheinyl transferase
MALIKTIKEEKSFIGIWQLTESTEMLMQMLKFYGNYQVPPHYTHVRRIQEWITVRLLLHELLPHRTYEIYYDEYGKPFLANPQGFISISHTHGYVGVMYHETNNCGFDLELMDDRIEKIAEKFLRADEEELVEGNHALQKLYLVWTAKEVMYKIYGKKSLDFKENLKVLPFTRKENGIINGQLILNKDICPYSIHYSIHGQLLISSGIQ